MKPSITLVTNSNGEPKNISVRCSKTEKEKVKEAGNGSSRWEMRTKSWILPADPVAVKRLKHYLPDITESSGIKGWLEELKIKQNSMYSALKNTEQIVGESRLYPFQRAAVRMLDEAGSLILGDEMGLGKTPISCSAIKFTKSSRVIIVCPSQVKWSWVEHLRLWADIPKPYVIEANKSKSEEAYIIWDDREHQISQIIQNGAYVTVMGFEMMKKYIDIFEEEIYDLVIYDEAHRLKNRKSATAKAAAKLSACAKRNWLLTGTPVRNRHDDLYMLLSIVDPVRFSNYWDFVNLHMDYFHDQYNQVNIMGLADEQEFNAMISTYMLRRTKKEVMPELPDKIYTYHAIPMLPAQAEIYNEMEREFCLYIEKETDDLKGFTEILTAPTTVAQIIRLRQICLAPSMLGFDDVESAKILLLKELISDLHEQNQRTVVFTYFRKFVEEIKNVLDEIGVKYGQIVGGQSSSARYQLQDALKKGDIDMIIGTAQSMGEGMNLQAATTAIFCDTDWVPANNMQAEDRIHRSGIKSSPNIIKLYHPQTIESDIMLACDRKTKVISEAIGSAEVIRSLMLRNNIPIEHAF